MRESGGSGGEAEVPLPSGFMWAVLRLCPRGLPMGVLQDVLAAQGIDPIVAAQTICHGLSRGTVGVSGEMKLVWHE